MPINCGPDCVTFVLHVYRLTLPCKQTYIGAQTHIRMSLYASMQTRANFGAKEKGNFLLIFQFVETGETLIHLKYNIN